MAWITAGPIFRPINRHGQVLPDALTGTTVAAIVKAYADRAGLDAATLAGHSLRRGFLTPWRDVDEDEGGEPAQIDGCADGLH